MLIHSDYGFVITCLGHKLLDFSLVQFICEFINASSVSSQESQNLIFEIYFYTYDSENISLLSMYDIQCPPNEHNT